jgi:hypothetical protein
MAVLQNSTLDSSGRVFLKAALSSTLSNSTLTSSTTGIYQANLYINEYLTGKGVEPYDSDYRYFYYNITPQLQTAIDNMPLWYLFYFYYPPV